MTDGQRIKDRITDAVVEGVARDLGFDIVPLVKCGQGREDWHDGTVTEFWTIWRVLGLCFVSAVMLATGYLLGMAGR